MSRLTTKQEKYVQGLIAGLSQRKAYREAYPSARKWKDSTVDSRASELLADSKVLGRHRELLDEHKNKALWTRERAVNELIWLVERAKDSIDVQDEGYTEAPPSNAFMNAIKELNRLELLYPLDQKEAKKLDLELEPDIEQDDKLMTFADKLDEVFKDE